MKAPFITLALIVSTLIASAQGLWPQREAKVLKSEKDPLNEQTTEERKAIKAGFQEWLKKDRATYRAGEFQASLFAAASFDEVNIDSIERSDYGVGIGFNYFVTRNLGAGFEARHLLEHSDNFLNRMGYHVIARLPFDVFSPYLLVGGGYRYQDHDIDGYAYGEAGVELRLSPLFSVFGGFRTETENFKEIQGHQLRAGVTLVL
jgi:hypothetical protein